MMMWLVRKPCIFLIFLIRGYSFSTGAKLSEQLIFLTPWYVRNVSFRGHVNIERIFNPLIFFIFLFPHIETSQLIWIANQLIGFYMRAKLAFNGLRHFTPVYHFYTPWKRRGYRNGTLVWNKLIVDFKVN